MTETPALPPLTLDDIRVAEPDRDNAEAFDPYQTWFLACGFVSAHCADDVARLLLELTDDELEMVHDVAPVHEPFGDRKGTAAGSKPVAADGAEVALCRALNQMDSRERWLPIISRASVYDVVAERDRLKAENAKLRELLGTARDLISEWQEVHVWGDDQDAPADCSGSILKAEIDKALAEGAR